jgi:hypothetical protein
VQFVHAHHGAIVARIAWLADVVALAEPLQVGRRIVMGMRYGHRVRDHGPRLEEGRDAAASGAGDRTGAGPLPRTTVPSTGPSGGLLPGTTASSRLPVEPPSPKRESTSRAFILLHEGQPVWNSCH